MCFINILINVVFACWIFIKINQCYIYKYLYRYLLKLKILHSIYVYVILYYFKQFHIKKIGHVYRSQNVSVHFFIHFSQILSVNLYEIIYIFLILCNYNSNMCMITQNIIKDDNRIVYIHL